MTSSGTSAKELKAAGITLALISVITFLAYKSILFNFFSGDDFVHLEWLHRAFAQPEMLWRNFVTNWPNVETCKFYRPLIPLSLAFDYAIWRNNGLGFHLTNVFIHLINSVVLYLVLFESGTEAIQSRSFSKPDTVDSITSKDLEDGDKLATNSIQLWALSSAALFAIYPLHPEPVSWISGRVDTIVAMFLLSSLWLYLKARRLKNVVFMASSLLCFTCALGSKEMAVAFPLVLAAFEVLLPTRVSEDLKERSFKTLPFWICLLLYFILRRFALGTFIGGYDDSLAVNPGQLIASWAHAFKLMWLPFNAEVFPPGDMIRIFWMVTTAVALWLFLESLMKDKIARLLGGLLISWFLLTLLPVFKVLSINNDLQGSRLAYLATGPLCAILCLGCWSLKPTARSEKDGLTILRKVVLFSMLSLSFLALKTNNDPWRESGIQSSAVLHELDKLYSSSATDPPTYFVGLPDSIKGAYFMRNAIDGMTHYPQISRTATNCFVIDNFDPIFPFGFAREEIASNAHARIFIWSSKNRNFAPVVVTCTSSAPERAWRGSDLRNLLEASSRNLAVAGAEPSFIPRVRSGVLNQSEKIPRGKNNREIIFLFRDLPCWQSDVVVFRFADTPDTQDLMQCSLNYTNDLCTMPDLRHRVSGYLYKSGGRAELAFPLHAESDWAFGGNCHTLTLLAPVNARFTIDELRAEGPDKFIPKLTMKSSANQNSNGYIQLNSRVPTCSPRFDTRKIAGANGVSLEISKPNQCFEVRNAATPGRFAGASKSYSQPEGTITLSKNDFGQDGIYQVRIRALDSTGNSLGFAGDHVNVSVQK